MVRGPAIAPDGLELAPCTGLRFGCLLRRQLRWRSLCAAGAPDLISPELRSAISDRPSPPRCQGAEGFRCFRSPASSPIASRSAARTSGVPFDAGQPAQERRFDRAAPSAIGAARMAMSASALRGRVFERALRARHVPAVGDQHDATHAARVFEHVDRAARRSRGCRATRSRPSAADGRTRAPRCARRSRPRPGLRPVRGRRRPRNRPVRRLAAQPDGVAQALERARAEAGHRRTPGASDSLPPPSTTIATAFVRPLPGAGRRGRARPGQAAAARFAHRATRRRRRSRTATARPAPAARRTSQPRGATGSCVRPR